MSINVSIKECIGALHEEINTALSGEYIFGGFW